nr:hypothetical protein [Tanacetum cinerariifolium]GEV40892.1 hypothetical protein [Tanacetum cinerariifolium]
MDDMTAPSGQAPAMAPPVRTNEEIVYTNFHRAITASSTVLSIYIQLHTANIREASYYQEYQANVAKHRRFLAGETWGAQDSPAPKPARPTRNPKPTAQKAWINILQYLIHMCMCKDFSTKMMKMFLLVENLRQQNPNNHEVLHPGQILFTICATSGFGNPNAGSVTSFDTVISFTDAFSASSSDKTWNLILRNLKALLVDDSKRETTDF